MFDGSWLKRTRLAVYTSSKDALALDSKRSGTKLVRNLAKCRRFPTVLRRSIYYQTLCTGGIFLIIFLSRLYDVGVKDYQ